MQRRLLGLGLSGLLLAPRLARASTTVRVMTSGAFTAPYQILGPRFEAATGHRLATALGPSMGQAPDAIPQRLARGEVADVVILARGSLDALVRAGHVRPGSEVDLVHSAIAMAVRAGTPHPRIGTVEEFRQTLLNAASIGYSSSASGVYLSTELFARLGITEQMAGKARQFPRWVGREVANGVVELGFQQTSELLPIPGIEIVGPLPAPIQRVTTFSAGIGTRSEQPEAAQALIRFLAAPAAHQTIREAGLDPASA
ncbi:substrate-binding domain-containing protein [Sediminicoccus sp. KRV36]|uniref:substrate-binding domain-containing protein n=1 Tax=Sediminicoccus sp. KRV36 TaxID=3133721 RepID=UPI00200C05F2|nr:substrate-binding domain-containing protein [Sediminicoccus rosea]UPY39250.1 substrate-binding domain-containing protein [Sediminicoccus rosea]